MCTWLIIIFFSWQVKEWRADFLFAQFTDRFRNNDKKNGAEINLYLIVRDCSHDHQSHQRR